MKVQESPKKEPKETSAPLKIDEPIIINSAIRPWQGTTLGVFSVLALVSMGIGLLVSLLFIFGLGTLFSQYYGTTGFPGGMMMGIGGLFKFFFIMILPFVVLQFYVTKGIFSGAQWPIIVTLVMTGLSLLSQLSSPFLRVRGGFLILLVTGFLVYLCIICLKHPFYNSPQKTKEG